MVGTAALFHFLATYTNAAMVEKTCLTDSSNGARLFLLDSTFVHCTWMQSFWWVNAVHYVLIPDFKLINKCMGWY